MSSIYQKQTFDAYDALIAKDTYLDGYNYHVCTSLGIASFVTPQEAIASARIMQAKGYIVALRAHGVYFTPFCAGDAQWYWRNAESKEVLPKRGEGYCINCNAPLESPEYVACVACV